MGPAVQLVFCALIEQHAQMASGIMIYVSIGAVLVIGILVLLWRLVPRSSRRSTKGTPMGLGHLMQAFAAPPPSSEVPDDAALDPEQRTLRGYWLGDCYRGQPRGMVQRCNALEFYLDGVGAAPQWYVRAVPRGGGPMQTVSSRQFVADPGLIAYKSWRGSRPRGVVHRLSIEDMKAGR